MSYRPNKVPPKEQVIFVVFSIFLLVYGTTGIINDDLFILGGSNGSRSRAATVRTGVHLHGPAAWCIYAGMLCAVACMVSMVIDHYDKRDNEIQYKRFAEITQLLGVLFMFLGAFIYVVT